MRTFLAFFLALAAFGQMGTGGGAGGGGGVGAPPVSASSVSAVTSLTMNVSSQRATSLDKLIVQCWAGATDQTRLEATLPAAGVTTSGGIVTVITPTFTSTANVHCTATAGGSPGATGATGPAGAAGADGSAGAPGVDGASTISAGSGIDVTAAGSAYTVATDSTVPQVSLSTGAPSALSDYATATVGRTHYRTDTNQKWSVISNSDGSHAVWYEEVVSGSGSLGSNLAPALNYTGWAVATSDCTAGAWESPFVGPGFIKSHDGDCAISIISGIGDPYAVVKVTVTVSGYSGGSTGVNGNQNSTSFSEAGTYTIYDMVPATGGYKVTIQPNDTTTRFTVDSITVQQVVGNEVVFPGNVIFGGENTFLGGLGVPSLYVGGSFRMAGQLPSAVTPSEGNAEMFLNSDNLTFSSKDSTGVVKQMVQVLSGSLALATSSISAGACQTVTAGSVNSASAPGVTSTDVITVTPNGSIKAVTGYVPSSAGGLSITPYPSTDYINVDVCNWSGSAITPSPVTLNWRVSK